MGKILLIDPGIQLKTKENVKFINRGLLSIATFLKSKGVEVQYFPWDFYVKEGMSETEIFFEIKKIIKENDIKISAISNLFIAETENTLKIARAIKDDFPDNISVIGGYNPTIMNQSLIKLKEIDYVIKGEGERTLHDLISAIEKGTSDNIPGVVSKSHDGEEREPGNLRKLPSLDYSILPRNYLLGNNPPQINLELTRGCYHNCSFCSVSRFWQKKVKTNDPGKIIKELKQLKMLGYKGAISIEESMVNFKLREVKDCFIKMAAFRNDFTFNYVVTRYDFIDEEGLGILDKVGFENLIIGLESASNKVLEKTNKHIDLIALEGVCKMAKKFKIKLNTFIIVGLPGETHETYKETLEFLSRLMEKELIYSIFPCHFQPYPGTQARKDLEEIGGTILTKEGNYFNWLMRGDPLVEYKNLSAKELKKMMDSMLNLNKKMGRNPIVEKLK
jgi:radical SAM superfamily enzyme YgiQ (UPF0313 family)